MYDGAMKRVELLEALQRANGNTIVRLEERVDSVNTTLLRIEQSLIGWQRRGERP